jgi:hypothetical protein
LRSYLSLRSPFGTDQNQYRSASSAAIGSSIVPHTVTLFCESSLILEYQLAFLCLASQRPFVLKKYGCAATENACAAALELGVAEYRFVRRYLERSPQAPLTLRQVDTLIRELVQYRDLIQQRINFEETNHEPDRT